MNRDNERQSAIILSVIGIIPVVWLALLIAPSVKGGLPEILPSLLTAFNEPFHIELCEDSLKTVLVLLLCYAMGIGIYFSTQKNYRRREEHGSAKWGNARAVNKKYRQSPASANKLMTQNVCIGLNAKKHRRNLNTLVCGGSGAGKTRFYCKPNLMQCNTSFVILDPKGEILRDTGKLLESKGYEVRVTAFAASDPITVVNNLSDFIFGLIRAIGLILLGFGIVQVGLSLKSHDPSQRANGFLTLAGGIIITFAKEILTLITG